ncbi:hypothetical protein D6T64_13380 [Cryobacterium melibiosiphilum]|uniref:Uncharacterized protein n=1 Tax=Cryobacterium melibiosiphilum TaxID=995039 RepID=A0A3A5MNH5_9MICO|nr:hypothetical protein [Cryobacterium melibiosiphilum]RJT87596.1 hypothetical protein D6T64_13380 [Cryobacterium melibiosiphilum]
MTSDADHPFVTQFLRQFDEAAVSITTARRAELREEIGAHLRELVQVDTPDADATASLSRFGSPAEILGQELDGSSSVSSLRGRSRPTRRTLVFMLSAGAAATLLIVLVPRLVGDAPAPEASVDGTVTSVVTDTPQGPARVTTGTGYFEYQAAIDAMEDPLPAGAAYPTGVPEGLDSGSSSAGMMQSGAGNVVAHYTWLCAWESEYLTSMAEKDAQRQVAAEAMLTKWSTSEFYIASDPNRGWVETVLDPVRFGDPSGVARDQPQSCSQAGIVNVRG